MTKLIELVKTTSLWDHPWFCIHGIQCCVAHNYFKYSTDLYLTTTEQQNLSLIKPKTITHNSFFVDWFALFSWLTWTGIGIRYFHIQYHGYSTWVGSQLTRLPSCNNLMAAMSESSKLNPNTCTAGVTDHHSEIMVCVC